MTGQQVTQQHLSTVLVLEWQSRERGIKTKNRCVLRQVTDRTNYAKTSIWNDKWHVRQSLFP